MPGRENAFADGIFYSTDDESSCLSRSSSDTGQYKSYHAGRLQNRPSPPHGAYRANDMNPLTASDPKDYRLTTHPTRQGSVRSLPTPDCSPERPSHKRKASFKKIEQTGEACLTPPASDDEGDRSSTSVKSGSDRSLEFPLDRQPLPKTQYSVAAHPLDKVRTPNQRAFSAGNPNGAQQVAPKPSTDRFISNRASAYDLSGAFRATKSPQDLTTFEKFLRNPAASPDPFGRMVLPRVRERRSNITHSRGRLSQGMRNRSRTIGAINTISLPQDTSALQNRQASAGAVWNVGGSARTSQSELVRGISNGRGGFLSSGSNAPMYTADFLDDHTPEQEMETMEHRLATALDIDRTERLVNTSRSPGEMRSTHTGSIDPRTKKATEGGKTRWVNGQWVRTCSLKKILDAPLLRDDYYCTVLAYSHTARTLAVGLANRVYLWSEEFGVKYPPDDQSNHATTYVTSLSFSSTEGGHSILAIGRNTGQVDLWSLEDDEDIRFRAEQPRAIACVAFKPVTTRRPSERFGCNVATEELLVGDENGDVYYYSIEWMTHNQIDIHGWNGSMKLLAKISLHSQQICGLAWSPNGEYFATGANDNACCLFQVTAILKQPKFPPIDSFNFYRRPLQSFMDGLGILDYPATYGQPPVLTSLSEIIVPGNPSDRGPSNRIGALTVLHHASVVPGQDGSLIIGSGCQQHKWVHSAAVKAIAFCPWQRSLIATGGGSNDRAIHFYHTFSGACLATINVHAQVTSLIWSTTRREIAATFGYAQPDHPYRIAVFSWPECRQIVAIPWQSDMRALLAIPYPRGPGETRCNTRLGEQWYSRTAEEGCIVVACSDESVKFHEVWSGAAKATGGNAGLLGGSAILEGLDGIEAETSEVIR